MKITPKQFEKELIRTIFKSGESITSLDELNAATHEIPERLYNGLAQDKEDLFILEKKNGKYYSTRIPVKSYIQHPELHEIVEQIERRI